jgi:hypothetical protein
MSKAKRKASKPRKAVRKQPQARTKTARLPVPASGPVTLEEAKTLAAARSPRRAVRRAVLEAAPVATPQSVALERQKLEKQKQAEINERIKEYADTMKIMKARGVKGLPAPAGSAPKRRRAPGAAATSAALPLQIFAEGDSWFDYPVPFFGGGIIPRLEGKLGVPILNLAKSGDEVRFMLGVEQRELLVEHLTDGCPAGGAWDVLLFSGGGNDIVGNPMALWIKDFDSTVPPAKLIHQARFDAALALVKAGYEDLIGLRDALSSSTHLVLHAYDFAIPDGRGICHLGPWMKPTFDLHQFPSRTSATEVVKNMLRQFAALLEALQASHRNVTFINTQGTLTANTDSWHNELHPTRAGFTKFADLFHTKLKALFPGRVL